VEVGKSIDISGTVLDTSAGTQQDAVKANYPNGVPAISDASQSAWMNYLYEQQPMPTNAAGVPVSIDVIDSNGNYRNIGTTTSDMSGTFRFSWKPDIAGNYTVIATFHGSDSYYPSYAESGFVADSAPTTTTAVPTSAPASVVDTYFAPAVVGIILTIVIVGAAIILLQRKRP
jgi:hypothetical protein